MKDDSVGYLQRDGYDHVDGYDQYKNMMDKIKVKQGFILFFF